MHFEKYSKYTLENFILDKKFTNWVLHPDDKSNFFWNEFLIKFPKKRELIKEAHSYIKSFHVSEPNISQKQLDLIFYDIINPRPKSFNHTILKIASIFAFLITCSGILFYFSHTPTQIPFDTITNNKIENGKIIFPDGTIEKFNSEQTKIEQKSNGQLIINNKILNCNIKESKANDLIQIIIPFGKRSELTLSDGTKVWLNSGSKFLYPPTFSKKRRKVYLSGEAFFKVMKDSSRPFRVITSDINIRVLGTSFNVTSYYNKKTTEAVLVSGKIIAKKNKKLAKNIELKPGERIVYNKDEDRINIDNVDTKYYSCWIDGYMIFKNEPIHEIFKQLERYYNQPIITKGISQKITFTGKLNLADNLNKVLSNIAFASSFNVIYENKKYIITQ